MSAASINMRVDNAPEINIWPLPKPLPTGLLPVKDFDVSMLPEPMIAWVDDIANRMQAPPEFVAVPAMVAAGSIIGRKVGIRPQANTDWYEVPNLWGCIIGRPGVMKSPAVQQGLKPINRIQAEARRDYQNLKGQFDAGELEREMRQDAHKAEVKRRLKGNPMADTSDIGCPTDEEPILRRYIANDTSYQSLGELLIQNTNGLLVHRDELLSLLRGLDREDNCEARGFYLTGWNGTDDYTFDRIIRGTNLYVPSVTIGMVGSTQPGRMREYLQSAIRGGGGDDGLVQRFGMMVWPDVSPTWSDQDREPDPIARSAAFRAFDRLNSLTADEVGAQYDAFDQTHPYLRFDAAGLGMFQEWRISHEARLRSGDLHPAVESHLAKYRKLIPALALIHHLASGKTGPVGDLSVLTALAWGEFLESHAHRIYSAAINSGATGARDILRHLRKGDLLDGFSARMVKGKEWSGLGDANSVADALDILEEHGWIMSENVPTTAKGGRPTQIYRINPRGLS